MPSAVIGHEPKKEPPKRPTTKTTEPHRRRKVKLYRLPIPDSLISENDSDVELRVTLSDGSARTVKLPIETWFRGNNAAVPIPIGAGARVARVEIDPRNVYPDVERNNNVWNGATGSTP